MLHDAALIPDLSIEFPIGRDWSVSAGWAYAWWSRNRKHDYWRYSGGNAAVRSWFGKTHLERGRLSGHHIGITGSVFTFDFEAGGRGYLGGYPGGKLTDQACWSAGVEYGYSLPITEHLNIDFSAAAGYIGGKYWKYRPKDGCYVTDGESALRFVGPVSAEITLVWILGNRKGGRR